MERQQGRLKSGHYDGGFSRQKFKCPIEGCGMELRSDKLRDHYRSNVIWDDEGGPVSPNTVTYKVSKPRKQAHTKYFFDNGYTQVNIPPFRVPVNLPSCTLSNDMAKAAATSANMQDVLQEKELSDVEMERFIQPIAARDDLIPCSAVVPPIKVDGFEIVETVPKMVESVAAKTSCKGNFIMYLSHDVKSCHAWIYSNAFPSSSVCILYSYEKINKYQL